MKSRILILSLISIVLFFISCKNDDDDDNPSGNKKVCLTKLIINDTTYGTDSILYHYDEQNRLRKIVSGDTSEYTYNPNGTLSEMEIVRGNWSNTWKYFYQNGKIEYVVFKYENINHSSTDTTFYFYNINGLIQKSIQYKYNSSPISSYVIDYTYNNHNKLVTRYENRYFDGHLNEYDSSAYTWSNEGNLTKIIKSRLDEYQIHYSTIYDYEYDTKNNYLRSIYFRGEDHPIGLINPDSRNSVNNCVHVIRTEKDGSSFSLVYNYTEYNEQGYPLKMTGDRGTVEFEYEEY